MLYSISLSMNKSKKYETNITLKQGDNGDILQIMIEDDVDLTQYAGIIVFNRPDKTTVQGSLVYDSTNNYFTYTIKGNEIAVFGKIIADVKLANTIQNRFSTVTFTFYVEKDTISSSSVESSSQYDALQTALQEVEGIKNYVHKGEYNDSTTYEPGNEVSYNSNTYRCIVESTGNIPTNATYWVLIAKSGTDGENGVDGVDGTDGTNASCSVVKVGTEATITCQTGSDEPTTAIIKDGDDGISPSISPNVENTSTVYKLDVITKDEKFTTPNLMGQVTAVDSEGNPIFTPYTPGDGINISEANVISSTVKGNVQGDWSQTEATEENYIKNKPTALSAFTNDSNFITNTCNNLINYYLKSEIYTKEEVQTILNNLSSLSMKIIDSTESVAEPSSSVIYLIAESTYYVQWIYTDDWHSIGSTEVNLSGYVTIEALNAALANYSTTDQINTLLTNALQSYVTSEGLTAILENYVFSNRTQLLKIGEDESGNMTYDGKTLTSNLIWENITGFSIGTDANALYYTSFKKCGNTVYAVIDIVLNAGLAVGADYTLLELPDTLVSKEKFITNVVTNSGKTMYIYINANTNYLKCKGLSTTTSYAGDGIRWTGIYLL